MKFCILITAPPESKNNQSALTFCRALIDQKHSIVQIFFYARGVQQLSPNSEWLEFKNRYDISLVACETAIERYKPKLSQNINIAGLASFMEAVEYSDRMIRFGSMSHE